MGPVCCTLGELEGSRVAAVVVTDTAFRPGGRIEGAGRRWILQLGASNFQLLQDHHTAYNEVEDLACYSVYAAAAPNYCPLDERIEFVELSHAAPLEEHAPPVGHKPWHKLSSKEVEDYLCLLQSSAYEMMQRAEEEQGCSCTLAVALNDFLNPLVLRRVVQQRVQEGLAPTPIAAFCSEQELDMYIGKHKGAAAPRSRRDAVNAFCDLETGVRAVVFPREQVRRRFFDLFPDFPMDRTLISMPGYSPLVFHPRQTTLAETLSRCRCLSVHDSSEVLEQPPATCSRAVLFAGELSSEARLGAALRATEQYESLLPDVITMILHTTERESERLHPDLATEQFSTRQALFVEVGAQDDMASLYSVAEVCVFPLEDSPFQALVECMACGTPVIGVAKGMSACFITEEVGALVPRVLEVDVLAAELSKLITESLAKDWKMAKCTACLDLSRCFSVDRRCSEIIKNVTDMTRQ